MPQKHLKYAPSADSVSFGGAYQDVHFESGGYDTALSPTLPLLQADNNSLKRLFDVIFSALFVLLVFSWVAPILAFLVKLSSKGPVFFKQARTGRNGRIFTCYKFRTMQLMQPGQQETSDAQRITAIGAFMRHYRLDELPQFFNVLLGQMSVVGPRPFMLKHTLEYSRLAHQFDNRHLALPGITGLAQIKGYRGHILSQQELEGRLRLDLFYLHRWSLLLDVSIIFSTLFSLLQRTDK